MTPATASNVDPTPVVTKIEETLPTDIKQKASELADRTRLDPTKPDTVASLGANSQTAAAKVSEELLAKVDVKDAGGAGKLLASLTAHLRSVDVTGLKPGWRDRMSHIPLVGKAFDALTATVAGYHKTLTEIDAIVVQIAGARTTIMGDVDFLSRLYDQNLASYRDLAVWIEVGKIKRAELDDKLIPEADSRAKDSSNPLDAQAVNDLRSHRQRLDKRISDLEITKMLRLQNAPKIRMIQAGDISLAEQLQSSIVNGVPLFKDNLALFITQQHQKEAADIQQGFSDTLNDLVRQGADMLHDNSVQIATQAQRGILDFDTIKHQQEQLLRTVDDVAKVASDGAKNRETVRLGLAQMETELHARLSS